MLISYIILLVIILINAKYDAKLWKLGKYINHKVRFIARVIIIAGLALIPAVFLTFWYFFTIVMLASFFWLVFDVAIQMFKGNNAFQLGSTANTDKFLRFITKNVKEEQNKEYYAMFFKLALFIILNILYLTL